MSNNDIEKYMKMNYPISFVFEDDSYFVWYEDLPGCQADGETLEEAISNLETVKRDWIELALDRGMKIPKPGELSRYSGKLLLRLPLDLHKRIVMAARINRVSINTYIVKLLSEALAAKVFSTGDKQKNIFDIYDVIDIEGISKKFSIANTRYGKAQENYECSLAG